MIAVITVMTSTPSSSSSSQSSSSQSSSSQSSSSQSSSRYTTLFFRGGSGMGSLLLAGALLGVVLLSDELCVDDELLGDVLLWTGLRDVPDFLRSALISAAVSDRIFLSIASIGISNVSSDTPPTLPLPPTDLPHLGQNFAPSRSTAPQSGHLLSLIALAPHFGQN